MKIFNTTSDYILNFDDEPQKNKKGIKIPLLGEIAAVIIGDEATLKRVYFYPEKQKLVLQAENPKYEPLVYIGEELNEIRILGKAVAFQSDII